MKGVSQHVRNALPIMAVFALHVVWILCQFMVIAGKDLFMSIILLQYRLLAKNTI